MLMRAVAHSHGRAGEGSRPAAGTYYHGGFHAIETASHAAAPASNLPLPLSMAPGVCTAGQPTAEGPDPGRQVEGPGMLLDLGHDGAADNCPVGCLPYRPDMFRLRDSEPDGDGELGPRSHTVQSGE